MEQSNQCCDSYVDFALEDIQLRLQSKLIGFFRLTSYLFQDNMVFLKARSLVTVTEIKNSDNKGSHFRFS